MELSQTQQKLLKLLSINSRFTNKDIAKVLRVSPDTVEYQINSLLNVHNLGGFHVVIDYSKTTYKHTYHIFIRVKDFGKIPTEKLKRFHPAIYVNTSFGKYDLQVIVIGRNEQEILFHITKLEKLFEGNIQEYIVMQFASEYKYSNVLPNMHVSVPVPKNQKNPVYALCKESFERSMGGEILDLDHTDLKIVKELLRHPRASYLEISKKTNVPNETVRNRVLRFVREGLIMNFGLSHNFTEHGFFTSVILLKLSAYDEEKFRNYLASRKDIFYAGSLIGEFNCIVYTAAKTPAEFGEQLRTLREYFQKNIMNFEFMYFDKTLRWVQFPEELLK